MKWLFRDTSIPRRDGFNDERWRHSQTRVVHVRETRSDRELGANPGPGRIVYPFRPLKRRSAVLLPIPARPTRLDTHRQGAQSPQFQDRTTGDFVGHELPLLICELKARPVH